jgi:hypothetical protein
MGTSMRIGSEWRSRYSSAGSPEELVGCKSRCGLSAGVVDPYFRDQEAIGAQPWRLTISIG